MTLPNAARPAPGAIALLGSGEYLDIMNTTDTYLLETLGGASSARVVLLPTASGLEAHGPAYWNDLGRRHFQALGVREIRATHILDRESAGDPDQLALLRDADLYYFSGGDPEHIIDTLRGSPAWEIITIAHERGAVLAGGSAGAIALGAYTVTWGQMWAGETPGWAMSLGAVPGLVVLPHFDRMVSFLFPNVTVFRELLSTLPRGLIAVGIDENTALVGIDTHTVVDPTAPARWRVMGQHTVTVFERDRAPRTLCVGEEVMLLNGF